MSEPALDLHRRPLGALRISVTDRCNLRCGYCMPEAEYTWLPRASLLSFEELTRVARASVALGVRKVRLTGGEPLLRHELPDLIGMLRQALPGVELALTTNALLLAPVARRLRDAGLDRVTVSLDTLRPDRMERFARSARHGDVIRGIDAAIEAGFAATKLNTVVLRGYNDDEVTDIVRFAVTRGIEPRFIEYMDVGGATRWRMEDVVSAAELQRRFGEEFGGIVPLSSGGESRAPADRYRLGTGAVVGIIASTTTPFCRDCDRARLTADGSLLLCLYADQGIDLREPLRLGATDAELEGMIRAAWETRSDRGAELRAGVSGRTVLVPLHGLRADPHREMHTRGG
jgi:cyclic pyranopterin phosphate synthase